MRDGINVKSLAVRRDGRRLLSVRSVLHYMDASREICLQADGCDFQLEVLEGEGDICLWQEGLVWIQLYENTDYWIEFDENTVQNEALLEKLLARRNGCMGIINSGNYVGYLEEGCFAPLPPVEFVSRKLRYEEDYSYLQEALVDFFYGLLERGSSFFGKHYRKSDEVLTGGKEPYSQLAYVKSLFRPDRLPEWVEYLLYHSDYSYLGGRVTLPACQAQDITPEALADALRPDNLVRGRSRLGDFYPRELECERMVMTYDTPENRFVKFFLLRLMEFLEECGRGNTDMTHKIQYEVSRMRLELEEYLEHPFWSGIGSMERVPGNSQILQRKYPYNMLFTAYHNLDLRPALTLNELDEAYVTGQKDVPMLYQYFVFLKLFEYLGKQYPQEAVQADFIKYHEKGMDFTLREGGVRRAEFLAGGNRTLRLYYNKTYRASNCIYEGRSYSHSLKPDISLELFEGETLLGLIHFDAKYKTPAGGLCEEADIDKMHAYKDGILGSLGAYAVCLSEKKCLFVEEEYGMCEEGRLFPSVGAFPLHPGQKVQRQLADIFAMTEAFVRLPFGTGRGFEKGVRKRWRSNV